MSTVLKSKRKRLKGAHHALYLAMLLSILLPVLLANLSFSQVSGYAYCSGLFTGNAYSIFSYPTSLNNMLSLSLLAIAVMLLIVGMLYAIGFAFKIDKLVRFSKGEIGEVIITVLIVLVLIGTFSISSRITPSSPPVSPITGTSLFSDSQFMSACTEAANVSIGLLPAAISFTVQGSILSFLQSLRISIEPNFFGIAFSPLAGVSLITKVVGMLTDIAWGFVLLMAGVALFLFIIFAFFPIFLFVGVVLRTIPWTRAAGGAFLGIFIGFFLVLPALLSFTLNIGAISIFSGIGEAPQLSPTYAQYDNGASVFNFYDNFAGTSLSPKWVANGASYTVNNGLTYTPNQNYDMLVSATSFTSPYIIDYYGEGTASTGDGGVYFNVQGTGANANSILWAQRGSSGSDAFYVYTSGTYTREARWQYSIDGNMHIYTLVDGPNNNPLIAQKDYSTKESFTSMPSTYNSGSFGPRDFSGTTYWQWVRVRAYPPNGVMPSVSFGSVQTTTATSTFPSGIKYYVPVSITNSQRTAAPSPFQQMIKINEGNYASYITYNGVAANFEFFTQSGQVLPAWIESNSSGTLTVWVKLPSGIPASSSSRGVPTPSTLTIYLGFAGKTTNLLSSGGICSSGGSLASCASSQISLGSSLITAFGSAIGSISYIKQPSNMIGAFVSDVISPALYAIVGAIISILIAIDFAEGMGDFLGSPSLKSSDILKRLV